MTRYHITHERAECIACGACAAVSENWTLDTEDGLASPITTEIGEDDVAHNREAAEVCPVCIIHLTEIGK